MPYSSLDRSAWYTKSTQKKKKKKKKVCQTSDPQPKKTVTHGKKKYRFKTELFFNKKLPSHVFKKDC